MKEQVVTHFFLQQKQFSYKKGEILIHAEDTIAGVYFVETGYLKVYSLTESGEENIHFIYKPGYIFPLVWLFTNQNQQLYYEALTPVALRRSPRELFLNFIRADFEATRFVITYVIDVLSTYYERIYNLELTNSYARVLSRLLFLAKYFGEQSEGSIVFAFAISQKDIANSINVTRETANKALADLIKIGAIAYSGRSMLVIKDITKIEKELQRYYEK